MVLGPIAAGLAVGVAGAGAEQLQPGIRFPGVRPGNIAEIAVQIRDLRARGLEPEITTDPFTGGLVLSTRDQGPFLENILGTLAERELLGLTPTESAEIFRLREGFIEARRRQPMVPLPGADRSSAVRLRAGREAAAAGALAARLPTVSRVVNPCRFARTTAEREACQGRFR